MSSSLRKAWIDAHCHLTQFKSAALRLDYMSRAEKLGIRYFLQGGIQPQEWEAQLRLHEKTPGIIPVFGIHPWRVEGEPSLEVLSKELVQLEEMLPRAAALGELGLDFGPRCPNSQKDPAVRQIQVDLFRLQLRLARQLKLPIVLHVVQAHEQALQILKEEGPAWRGLVHAFSSSLEVAERYLELGLKISFGDGVNRKGFGALKRAVVGLPAGSWVVESDEPEHAELWAVARGVGLLRQALPEAVLDQSRETLITIFGPIF